MLRLSPPVNREIGPEGAEEAEEHFWAGFNSGFDSGRLDPRFEAALFLFNSADTALELGEVGLQP